MPTLPVFGCLTSLWIAFTRHWSLLLSIATPLGEVSWWRLDRFSSNLSHIHSFSLPHFLHTLLSPSSCSHLSVQFYTKFKEYFQVVGKVSPTIKDMAWFKTFFSLFELWWRKRRSRWRRRRGGRELHSFGVVMQDRWRDQLRRRNTNIIVLTTLITINF